MNTALKFTANAEKSKRIKMSKIRYVFFRTSIAPRFMLWYRPAVLIIPVTTKSTSMEVKIFLTSAK